jgi:signal transduction histidine kinase/ActR/RegA family two-component response regulator
VIRPMGDTARPPADTARPPAPRPGETILLYAPTGRDAELMRDLLARAGYAAEVPATIAALCERLPTDGGVAIVAEEALPDPAARCLLDALRAQPSWSDIPVVVLTTSLAIQRPERPPLAALRRAGNVSLLERPVHPVTLVSAVETALRARRRQYDVRDYLAERERAEERIRQAQKMDAVGQLAGGVAHEVNNMMTAVIGFGELLLKRLEGPVGGAPPLSPEAVRADVEEMVNAGKRAAAITQQLLAFSRQQRREPVLLRLQQVVPELAKLLRRLLGAEVSLVLRLPEDLPPIRADRNQLEQVLINLAVNARDAMSGGGSVTISSAALHVGPGGARRAGMEDARPGPWVQITVADTGHGMDRGTLERAFEPFFTTKPTGRGTGLGLSTVYGIVRQCEGYVWLDSEPGSGTTVTICLPAADSDPAAVTAVPKAATPRGRETILVVEDEEVVRRLTRVVLEERGYTVVEAADGVEALSFLANGTRGVQLVVSDIVMPRMSGRDFARELHRRHPGLPVIFMSGHPGPDVADRRLIEEGAPFLQKPFPPEELTRSVRELLDRAAARPG